MTYYRGGAGLSLVHIPPPHQPAKLLSNLAPGHSIYYLRRKDGSKQIAYGCTCGSLRGTTRITLSQLLTAIRAHWLDIVLGD